MASAIPQLKAFLRPLTPPRWYQISAVAIYLTFINFLVIQKQTVLTMSLVLSRVPFGSPRISHMYNY